MRVALLLLLLGARTAWAQLPDPEPIAPGPPAGSIEEPILTPTGVDLGKCQQYDLTPGAWQGPRPTSGLATPIPWTEFEIEGRLVDSKETAHDLIEPTLQQYRTSLSDATMPQVALGIARFGYKLVGHRSVDLPNGRRLVLELAPLPLIRRVNVKINRSYFGLAGIADKPLDDEIRQRMGLRIGSYLPSDTLLRSCALLEEQRRIEEFLHDEGYFEPTVELFTVMEVARAEVRVRVTLGQSYSVGRVSITCPAGAKRQGSRCINPATNTVEELAVPESEIRENFEHTRFCLLICIGTAHFTRAQFQSDIRTLRERFQRAGYPGVRIVASDPAQTLDRKTNTVNPVITIDERRRVEVEFQGHDPDALSDSDLRKALTFDAAASADDVEAENSAHELRDLLQKKGYFDALVTWSRDRIDTEPLAGSTEVGVHFDRITYHLVPGRQRRVVSVDFAGNSSKVMPDSELAKVIATKPSAGRSLFGATTSATSAEIILDQERIREAYRKIGYLDAQAFPTASITKSGLDNAALTASLLGTDDSSSLYVRYTIVEGKPTLLSRIVVRGANDNVIDDGLCQDILREVAARLKQPEIEVRAKEPGCVAIANTLPYHVEDVGKTREQVRDMLFKQGRTRAQVELHVVPFGVERVEARYTLRSPEQLRIGKIVVRGNFRTSKQYILNELGLVEGAPLTSDSVAAGEYNLRNMGLFDAVNVEWPDLACEEQRACNNDVINAVVRVDERYDQRAEISVEGGVSTYNRFFGTLRIGQPNLFGRGLRALASFTYGSKLKEIEGNLRIPPWIHTWLPRRLQFTTDLTGVYRIQDTQRFGILNTKALGVAFARQWQPGKGHAIGAGIHYDFRLRSRNVDAVRPIGADMDESQVAISTRTGTAGVTIEWDHRIDSKGFLNPLAPSGGFRLEGTFSYASPYLLGQDEFLKVSASGSKFFQFYDNFLLRIDARYDQGIPLNGAVLLPEVERFFAGGDPTVRGYADDRLATELVQVGVPPLDNITQIRVIPAGGNIRVLGSIDLQARIWQATPSISFAGAMFTDAGLITNSWKTVDVERTWEVVPTDIAAVRPSVGMGLRALTGFGVGALEYAVPLRPRLGDDPRGRIHFYFAARAQF